MINVLLHRNVTFIMRLNSDDTLFLFIVYQPPKIKSFINGVIAAPLESIEEPLKGFFWDFEKVSMKSYLICYLILPVNVLLVIIFTDIGRLPSLA